MKHTYKLKEPKENPLDSVIEKRGITSDFTAREVLSNIDRMEKVKKELEGKLKIESAAMENIEHFHPFVKDMSEQDRNTVSMYRQSEEYVKQIPEKLKEIDEAILLDRASLRAAEAALGLTFHVTSTETKEG